MDDSATAQTSAAGPRRLRPAEARELLAAGRAVLADVRDPALYENAHPQGAVSLPFAAIQGAGGRLPDGFSVPDRALVILYCA